MSRVTGLELGLTEPFTAAEPQNGERTGTQATGGAWATETPGVPGPGGSPDAEAGRLEEE